MRKIDLDDVVEDLTERHLGTVLDDIVIDWGDPTALFGGEDPCLACVDHDGHDYVITLDRVLALRPVPLYYLKDVVWHEIAHAVLHDRTGDWGADHGPLFQLIASLYSGRLRAQVWENKHGTKLSAAIRRRRRQAPLGHLGDF